MATADNENAALCCAQFYENDVIQQLLGESFHPGGKQLSRHLIQSLNLQLGSTVLDVACGIGTTAHMVASDFGCHVTGVDFSDVNVSRATELAKQLQPSTTNNGAASLDVVGAEVACCSPGDHGTDCCEGPQKQIVNAGPAKFVQGSADQLPFADGSFDAVICECAVSTFTDQAQVAREFYRVLKPGGVFGMTDMVVNGELPENVANNIAPWTCMSKALTIPRYQRLFLDQGFSAACYSDQSSGLLELISELKRKLVMAGVGKALGALASLNLDIREMRSLLGQATELVNAGVVEYGLLVFSKGRPRMSDSLATKSGLP